MRIGKPKQNHVLILLVDSGSDGPNWVAPADVSLWIWGPEGLFEALLNDRPGQSRPGQASLGQAKPSPATGQARPV